MLDIQKIKDGVRLAAQEYPIKKSGAVRFLCQWHEPSGQRCGSSVGVPIAAHFSAHTERDQVSAGGHSENGRRCDPRPVDPGQHDRDRQKGTVV